MFLFRVEEPHHMFREVINQERVQRSKWKVTRKVFKNKTSIF